MDNLIFLGYEHLITMVYFVIWMINETVAGSSLPTVKIWNQWSFELETCLLFNYLLLL